MIETLLQSHAFGALSHDHIREAANNLLKIAADEKARGRREAMYALVEIRDARVVKYLIPHSYQDAGVRRCRDGLLLLLNDAAKDIAEADLHLMVEIPNGAEYEFDSGGIFKERTEIVDFGTIRELATFELVRRAESMP